MGASIVMARILNLAYIGSEESKELVVRLLTSVLTGLEGLLSTMSETMDPSEGNPIACSSWAKSVLDLYRQLHIAETTPI